ncbi:MAG: long-chain fatty acid--CoA ligase [Planctomycetaceae bacterium]|nr:long-chain fatty acid--CoA ligase [Planctomycetaceae bacterium]
MDGLMMDFPLTLDALLRRAETIHGGREVVSRLPDRSWHRTDLGSVAARSKCLAQALQKLGVTDGDRVGTLCWNHFRHLEAYFGIPIGGAVLHTLNLRLSPQELAHIINEAADKVVIVDESLLSVWEAVRPLVAVEHVIVCAETDQVPPGMLNYETLLAECDPATFVQPALREKQAASMCYTSGTAGKSKGVAYSHRAICLHTLAAGLTSSFELYERDCVLPVVPMFHVNAWGLPYVAAMCGAKIVFPGPHLDPQSLVEAITQEQVTVSAGVPTVWISVLKELDQNPGRYDVSTVRKIFIGGSALPGSLIESYESRHDIRLVHAWGMTETTPIGTVSYLRHDQHDDPPTQQSEHRARQGTPVPFVEIRAIREEQQVPWDGRSMGELEVRGPWVAESYYQRPDAADRFSPDGWLRTGDIVSIDPRGVMKIEDRVKDLIKSGGEWISSVDLENALMAHEAVEEAAVIAVPDEKWVERPLAAVVVKSNQAVTAEQLREHLLPRVAKWWIPERFEFVSAIPRTSVGKFNKVALRHQLLDA